MLKFNVNERFNEINGKEHFCISFKNQFPLLNSPGNKLKIAQIFFSLQKKKNGITTHNYKKRMTVF